MTTRNTKQKQTVSEILHTAERPLTVLEILVKAQENLPTLGIATVYREISRLCESGDVHIVEIPGDPPRYEIAKHHHHHFKCTQCKNVFELEGCLSEVDQLVPKGFKVQKHEITLYGLCSTCAK